MSIQPKGRLMDEPWFRRFCGFSYRPIRWQGYALLAAMLGISLPCGMLFLRFAETKPLLGWSAAIFAMLGVLAGHAVVVWKLEKNYR